MLRHTYHSPTSVAGALLMLFSLVILSGCFRKVDKEKSDIAGIIPHIECDTPYPTFEVRRMGGIHADTFSITVDGYRHLLSANGDLFGPNGRWLLNVGHFGSSDLLYYIQKGHSLFLFFPGGSRCAGGFAFRIDISKRAVVWCRQLNGKALGMPVIRGQFAYIHQRGFVGKLKLKDGSFDWQYANIGRDGHLDSFNSISFPRSHEVLFLSTHAVSGSCDSVVINDLTGEMKRMTVF